MKPRIITLEEARKIAEDYCAKNHPYRRSVFRGMFEGKYLFKFRFERSGHYGKPVLFIVRQTGESDVIDRHSDAYDRAWDFSIRYAESLDGS